jgi:polysaccharide deacetylase family sporulation protein PdaB
VTVACALILVLGSLSVKIVPAFAPAPKEACKPIYRVDTKQKRVAISFDAAWGADKTAEIMDIVESKGANATFFLVGFWAEKYPELVRDMDKRGFEVGNHSSTHPHMGVLSAENVTKEIEATNEKIRLIIGKKPTVFRPPFGDYSDTLVNTVRGMDMHCVQWDVDSLDWKELGTQHTINTVLNKTKEGSIILFHNNAKYILEALPVILDRLTEEGYEIVSISELIHQENYYVDHAGIQHSK